MGPTKPQAPTDAQAPSNQKSGLPGTAKQRRARIRAAIKVHRETLRRLAR
jgi:hypothetical protein